MRIYSNRNMIVQSQLSYLLTLRTVGEALDASLSGVPSVGTGYGVLQLCKRLRLYGSTSKTQIDRCTNNEIAEIARPDIARGQRGTISNRISRIRVYFVRYLHCFLKRHETHVCNKTHR